MDMNEIIIKNLEESLEDLRELKEQSHKITMIHLVNYLYTNQVIRRVIDSIISLEKINYPLLAQLKEQFKKFLQSEGQNSAFFSKFLDSAKCKQLIEDFYQNPFDYYEKIPEALLFSKAISEIQDPKKFEGLFIPFLPESKRKIEALTIIKDLCSTWDLHFWDQTKSPRPERIADVKDSIIRLLCADLIEQNTSLFETYKRCNELGLIGIQGTKNFTQSWEEILKWKEAWRDLKPYRPYDIEKIEIELRYIIREIIRSLRYLIDFNFWLDRYMERTSWFNKSLVEKFSTSDFGSIEDYLSQDLLIYLHDNGIVFSKDQHKQGFRPDVETTHSVLEIKVITSEDNLSKIQGKIDDAKNELEQQKRAHPAHYGVIIIFNCSNEHNLFSQDTDKFKIIDFQIGLYDFHPSNDKRKQYNIKSDGTVCESREHHSPSL